MSDCLVANLMLINIFHETVANPLAVWKFVENFLYLHSYVSKANETKSASRRTGSY